MLFASVILVTSSFHIVLIHFATFLIVIKSLYNNCLYKFVSLLALTVGDQYLNLFSLASGSMLNLRRGACYESPNSYRYEYSWCVVNVCLSFCNYHVGFVVLGPDHSLRESFDLKLFILIFQGCLSYN